MGNSSSVYGASPGDYIDDNIWFAIYVEEQSVCSGDYYSGFLRYPYDDPAHSKAGVAVFDPSIREDINKVAASASKEFRSGYCWRISSDGKRLVGKKPSGGEATLQGIVWWWAPSDGGLIENVGFPTGGSIMDAKFDMEKSKARGQLWFDVFNDTGNFASKTISGLPRARTDWADNRPDSAYTNPRYAKARFCLENPSSTYVLRAYAIDLGSNTFIGEPVPLSVFMNPKGYKDWYLQKKMIQYWTAPGKKAPEPHETMIQTWLKSMDPTTRSKVLFQTQRCSYPDGDSYWGDEICRYGCNGDGSKNNPSLTYCPQIGSIITKPPYPNDYLRSEMGRAYCKQNPGKCEGALTAWCANDAPDSDGKYATSPFGKKSMCACSWGMDIRRKKILQQMPSVQQMLAAKDIFTQQVGERILQSQLAYFTCKDPECIESSVYKNQEDKSRPCPSDQIQNCITNITVDAGGAINVKDISGTNQCSQTLQQILGNKEFECIKNGGKIVTDANGNSTCCTGTVIDGKCMAKCPDGQVSNGKECVCISGKMVNGKCVSDECKGEFFQGKCVEKCPPGYKRLPDGSCATECSGEYFKGQCVEKCKPGFSRDLSGHCVRKCDPGYEIVGDDCKVICPSGQTRDYTGKCIVIKPDPPKPTPNPDDDKNPIKNLIDKLIKNPLLIGALVVGVALIVVMLRR